MCSWCQNVLAKTSAWMYMDGYAPGYAQHQSTWTGTLRGTLSINPHGRVRSGVRSPSIHMDGYAPGYAQHQSTWTGTLSINPHGRVRSPSIHTDLIIGNSNIHYSVWEQHNRGCMMFIITNIYYISSGTRQCVCQGVDPDDHDELR